MRDGNWQLFVPDGSWGLAVAYDPDFVEERLRGRQLDDADVELICETIAAQGRDANIPDVPSLGCEFTGFDWTTSLEDLTNGVVHAGYILSFGDPDKCDRYGFTYPGLEAYVEWDDDFSAEAGVDRRAEDVCVHLALEALRQFLGQL